VVVFARVGAEEIGARGVAVVMIKAAGEIAQIGVAGEFKDVVRFRDLQRDGVVEADGERALAILRVKTGLIDCVIGFCDEAAEFVLVAAGLADPHTLPASLKVIRWRRSLLGDMPVVIKSAATAGKKDHGEQVYGGKRLEEGIAAFAHRPVGQSGRLR
jgi:hypothetical protein